MIAIANIDIFTMKFLIQKDSNLILFLNIISSINGTANNKIMYE